MTNKSIIEAKFQNQLYGSQLFKPQDSHKSTVLGVGFRN